MEKEASSLLMFHEQFDDLPKGNIEAFIERLFEVHGLYKGKDPSEFLNGRKLL
jgi:hypothetical protein